MAELADKALEKVEILELTKAKEVLEMTRTVSLLIGDDELLRALLYCLKRLKPRTFEGTLREVARSDADVKVEGPEVPALAWCAQRKRA